MRGRPPTTTSLEGGVQFGATQGVEAVIGDQEALRAEIARLQMRVAELEALVVLKQTPETYPLR
jgi:hypothetical protein